MKKTVYLAILALVTVFCIIIGSVYHISGWIGFGLGNLFSFISDDANNGSSGHNNVTYSEDLDAFNRIEIDSDVMNVTIQEGAAYHLEYDCPDYREPEFEVTGSRLKIKQSPAKGWFRNHYTDKSKITVTIPSGTVLDSTEISTDVGNAYINDIQCSDFSIEADVGNIEINLCTFERSEIESDVGNIDINKSTLGRTNIDTDTGNVNLDECGFGDLEIYNDVGNVTLDSKDIDLSNYKIDLSTDLGSIRYNGQKQKKHFYQEASGTSASYNITIETDIGKITFN